MCMLKFTWCCLEWCIPTVASGLVWGDYYLSRGMLVPPSMPGIFEVGSASLCAMGPCNWLLNCNALRGAYRGSTSICGCRVWVFILKDQMQDNQGRYESNISFHLPCYIVCFHGLLCWPCSNPNTRTLLSMIPICHSNSADCHMIWFWNGGD